MGRESLEQEITRLMAGDVRDYLLTHPDFLVANEDLLTWLTPPLQQRGQGIRDFQHFMIARLQEEVSKLKAARDEGVQLIRENLERQSKINAAALALLEAPTFVAMVKVITKEFIVLLDHEAVALLMEEGATSKAGANESGVSLVPQGFVREWLPQRNIALEGNIYGVQEIFGVKAGKVRSQALVRISIHSNGPQGMLAFGHRDPNYYATGLATEQILHLATLTELCARTWLVHPQ